MTEPDDDTPAGWYANPDPDQMKGTGGRWRYWDGDEWTNITNNRIERPTFTPATKPQPDPEHSPTSPTTPTEPRPQWTTGQALGCIVVIIGILVALYGLGQWPLHDEHGLMWALTCGDRTTDLGEMLACHVAEKKANEAIVMIVAGAAVAITGSVIMRRTRAG